MRVSGKGGGCSCNVQRRLLYWALSRSHTHTHTHTHFIHSLSVDIFAKFLQEHTILVVQNQEVGGGNANDESDDDEDDDMMLEEPSSGPHRIKTVSCYRTHLQRIRDRHFYQETGPHTFVVEVPLDELVAWNNVQGSDLAERAENNTLRYQALFCSVVDEYLKSMEPSASMNPAERDTIDILQDQRMRAMEESRQQQQQQQQGQNGDNGGIHDPYNMAGNLQEENNNNNNTDNANTPPINVTEDLPAELTRRYELRILPKGRRGSLPPFVHQQVRKGQTYAQGLALRHVRSRSMGHLVTIRGMIVRSSDVKPCCVIATYSCDACGAEGK